MKRQIGNTISADTCSPTSPVIPYGQIMRVKIGLLSLLALLCLVLSSNLFAHKLDTHVWIAQQVLNDLLEEGDETYGKLKFPEFDEEFAIDHDLLIDLLRCQDEYRMGAIGPDAFPDMVGGQMTTHPGVKDHEGTNDWLERMLVSGTIYNECDNAFAYGYLTHAASDVFAHSYVNIYSGDIFDFGNGSAEDTEEELRHMALEAFVSEHMPPIVDNNGTELVAHKIINVPEQFVKNVLILNPDVANEYRAAGSPIYLARMYDLWSKLNEWVTDAESLATKMTQKISGTQVCLGSLPLVGSIGCIDLEPIYDKICLDCGQGTACDLLGWDHHWYCDVNACDLLLNPDPVGCKVIDVLDNSGQILADSITLPLRQWRDAVEEAVRQYVLTGEEIAKEILRGDEGDPMGAYTRWLTCWGPAFSGAIPPVGAQVCDNSFNVVHKITDGVSSFVGAIRDASANLPNGIGWALDPMGKFDREIKPEIYQDLGQALAAQTDEEGILNTLINMRLPEHNDGTLNGVFAFDSSTKGLLVIPDIAARVRKEMNLPEQGPGHWSLSYPVIHNSVVLSKLLLLHASAVNDMVRQAGITSTAYGPELYSSRSPFSPLLGMARSIDGSHQWQEYSPPYARDCDSLQEVDDPEPGALELDALDLCIQKDKEFPDGRNYGYSFAEPEGGFRLWQDCEVREKVFKKIFKGPIAPGLELAGVEGEGFEEFVELLPRDHPLRGTRKDPFPLSSASEAIDNIPPVPDVPELPPVFTSCKEPASVGAPTATDTCQGIFFGETADSLSYGSPGEYEITWVYDDEAGNKSSQTQLIIVQDDTPPTLTPPPSVSVEQTSLDGTPATLGAASATDNCDGDVTLSDDAPDVFPLGETVVTFSAVDASGNRTEQQVSVTVVDTTPPVLSNIPGDVTLEQETLDGATYDVGMPLVSDICDAEPDLSSDAPAVYPLGITEVTFTATDDSGNVATASTWVTVEDTTPPVLESVTPSKDYLWPPSHKMRRVEISPVVSDICDADPQCRVVEVTSNQPINDTADGDTDNDWEIIGDLKVKLLAERAGNDFSEPRIYTITTECADVSGNISNSMSATVVVPVEIEDIGN